jgi:retron-type reverse transcriptase
MRRSGNLIEAVAELDNLKLAYTKACRAKPLSRDSLEFRCNLDTRLIELGDALRSGTYVPGPYRFFTIYDPKERLISAVAFRDRVAQHALMNVLDPLFERVQIHHSYACRRNKGMQAAVLAAFHHAKSQKWFLKLDVRKYFDSIDHAVLASQLEHRIKDRYILSVLDSIIESYETSPGRGLPIGNLTSQYFANHYLSGLDHYILEGLHISRYVRYMDDMILLADSKGELGDASIRIADYAGYCLKLIVKPPILNRTVAGIPFCGFLVKPHGIFLMEKTRRRFKNSQRALTYSFLRGDLSPEQYADRALASSSHLGIARAQRFRYAVYRQGFFGHEPG